MLWEQGNAHISERSICTYVHTRITWELTTVKSFVPIPLTLWKIGVKRLGMIRG